MIIINKTKVRVLFDSGTYKGGFAISNKYLSDYWFPFDHKIWNELSIDYASITEKLVKHHIKEKINDKAFKTEYGEE